VKIGTKGPEARVKLFDGTFGFETFELVGIDGYAVPLQSPKAFA
jgi:hypothetical protein